jgi:hypothetical protein
MALGCSCVENEVIPCPVQVLSYTFVMLEEGRK